MKYNDPTLRQILAGEYALGALHGAARARFERLLRRDPALRRLVQEWQQLLAPLVEETVAVTPPSRVLAAIKRRINPIDAQRTSWWERLGFWRGVSALGAAAVIVLAVTTTFLTPPPTAAPNYVAVLQDQAAQPVLVVTAFKEPWRLTIEPVASTTLRADQVLQVWAVEKETGVVRPLTAFAPDLSRQHKAQQIALTEAHWKLIKTAHSLTVSIESAGSRPTAPTTPILYSGLCINLKGV